MPVDELLQETARAWGDVAKMLSAIVVGSVSAIGATKLYVMPYFAASGPAIELHEMKLVPSNPGLPSYLILKVSKLRPCKPSVVILELTDNAKRTFIVDIGWTRPLATKPQQVLTFDWMTPRAITGGPATAHLSVTHAQCDDGGRAPVPVDITSRTVIYVE